MKKLLVAIGSLLIIACVVVLFVYATGSKKEATKASTEVTKTEAAAPCSATCTSTCPSMTKEVK